jgi:hypothetical protein
LESILARPRPVCNICVPFTATYLPMGGYAFVSLLDRLLTRRARPSPHVESVLTEIGRSFFITLCLVRLFSLSSQQPSSAGRAGLIRIVPRPSGSETVGPPLPRSRLHGPGPRVAMSSKRKMPVDVPSSLRRRLSIFNRNRY